MTGGSASATFVKSSKQEQPDEAYLRYAHGIVSEYLMDDLSNKLLKQLNLPDESQLQNLSNKRKSGTNAQSDSKKIKFEGAEPAPKTGALDLSKPDPKIKPPTASSKDKARAKAASGSKSISSFFKKK